MSRPIIAFSCNPDQAAGKTMCGFAYERAVDEAGGIPLLLSSVAQHSVDELLSLCDGLLLTGGVDPDPLLFCRAAVAMGLPVLGICRGVQILNVAMGGTLIQDIPSQIPGAWKHAQQCPATHATHIVDVEPGSRLAALFGKTRLVTNSHHHEAVARPAPGFTAAAYTADGVVEAIEAASGWVVGVQWHPEALAAGGDPDAKALFSAFVAECAKHHR